jgi:hypothetical protein
MQKTVAFGSFAGEGTQTTFLKINKGKQFKLMAPRK